MRNHSRLKQMTLLDNSWENTGGLFLAHVLDKRNITEMLLLLKISGHHILKMGFCLVCNPIFYYIKIIKEMEGREI